MSLTYTFGTGPQNGRLNANIFCNRDVLVVDMGPEGSEPNKLNFQIYSVTKVGKEILSLATFKSSKEYLQLIADKAITLGAESVSKGILQPDGEIILNLHVIATKVDSNTK